MEGVTYSMRDSLAIFDGLGVPVRQIRASGGGSRSPFWRQIQADVFGRKVVTINTEEGPAYGVALLAAVGAGAFKNIDEACAATIRVVKETAPTPAAKKHYDRAFPIYQQLYPVAEGRLQEDRGLGGVVSSPGTWLGCGLSSAEHAPGGLSGGGGVV